MPTFIIPVKLRRCSYQQKLLDPPRLRTGGQRGAGTPMTSAWRSFVTAVCKLNMTNRFPASPLATSGPPWWKTELLSFWSASPARQLSRTNKRFKDTSCRRVEIKWILHVCAVEEPWCSNDCGDQYEASGGGRWVYFLFFFHRYPSCSLHRGKQSCEKAIPHVEGVKTSRGARDHPYNRESQVPAFVLVVCVEPCA